VKTTSIVLDITYDETRFRTSPEHWDWSYLVSLPNTILSVNTVRTLPNAGDDLNASSIFHLMFGEGASDPQSIHIRDHPIDRVKVLPFNLGKLLAHLDPDEQFFHIEFYPQRNVAEVWSRRSWNESLTRRLRLVKDDDSLVARRNSLRSELRFFLAKTTRCGSERADKLADMLVSFGSENDYLLDLLSAPTELKNNLMKYREECNNEQPSV